MNTQEKLKTQFWGEVDVDEQTYGALLELYKVDGIAAIVKIAAHIAYVGDVDYFRMEHADGTPGDDTLASELFQDLCELVLDAQQFDSDANLGLGI